MKTNDGSATREFIELVERIGLSSVVSLVAQACEVEADNTADENLGREWPRLRVEFEKLARTVTRLEGHASSRACWEAASPSLHVTGEFIGSIARYVGSAWPSAHGGRYRIVGVVKRLDDGRTLVARDNAELSALGGVSARDFVDVREIKPGGQDSFVAAEAYAIDLDVFAPLRAAASSITE